MGVKKLAIPALATAGGAGAGAGGAYATGSYLSQPSVKSDVSSETSYQPSVPSFVSQVTGVGGIQQSKTGVSTITNQDYSKKYSDYTNSNDIVIAGECSRDIFNISDFTKGSDSETTTSEKGCLYVDVQKYNDQAVLVTIEMTLMNEDKGLIFGTKIYNTTTTHEVSTRSSQLAKLRQNHWSLRVDKKLGENKWKVKDGWRWGGPIFSSSYTAPQNITLKGKVVSNDVIISLSNLCSIDTCSKDGSMESVLNGKYKWKNEASEGKEMFEFLDVSLSGFEVSIPYWTGKKLIFDESNEGDNVDGSKGPYGSESGRSKCEQKQEDSEAPDYGRIFYTHKWSENNWKKETIVDNNKPFVLTECAFDVVKSDDQSFKTTKFLWRT